ncbi:hypothetical protein MZO42_16930 [Sphingomonas psychrotolerans]|uniref:Sensor histidine kinase n=1 Tax=Sphingomonas psychrotolerans TaxID=1327635 RepID=A0ABU3N7L7_9SPHN|nr:hypothetical protein [Sphingomonas psychrotolerans]MDT8760388.1 hypothetical protein [Sphingomonas psychrotolerans]
MNWLQLGGSVAAVLILAWVSWLLKLGESRIDDGDTAKRMAEEALSGFVARAALVGTNGAAALVLGNDGIALLKRHGAKVAVRRLGRPLWRRPSPEGVTIETGERMFGPVLLYGVLPEDVDRLEAQLTLH